MTTVSVLVDRSSLSLSSLELQDIANGYWVDAVGPGPVTWRRTYATSPYVEGSSLVVATRDQATSTLTVNVSGSSAAQLESRTLALLTAFEQFAFTLTVTLDGIAHAWSCDAADYGPADGVYNEFEIATFQQRYVFSIPRQPVTTTST